MFLTRYCYLTVFSGVLIFAGIKTRKFRQRTTQNMLVDAMVTFWHWFVVTRLLGGLYRFGGFGTFGFVSLEFVHQEWLQQDVAMYSYSTKLFKHN